MNSILTAIDERADVETLNHILMDLYDIPVHCGYCGSLDGNTCRLTSRELAPGHLVERPAECPKTPRED